MQNATQTAASVTPYPRSDACIRFILAFGFLAAIAIAADPPPDLARKVAVREAENEAARNNYTYRQTVIVEEMDSRGGRAGEYREVREVIFSPEGDRTDRMVGKPLMNLKRMKQTEEDFRDLREVQPFLFTPDRLWAYETKFRGEETVDDVDCWVLQVRPRQILQGQRLFDGNFWIDKRDYSIVRTEGQAVPQIHSTNPDRENLFPHFTTIRENIGGYWFPVHTHADDTLQFRNGPLRMRLTVRYLNYQKFQAESKIVPSQR
jgi:hypothetical protein